MPQTMRRGDWQYLKHSAGKVMITTEDGDRFALRVSDVIRVCKTLDGLSSVEEFASKIKDLLGRIHGWLMVHRDKVDSAYIAMEASQFSLVVVQKGAGFDSDFEDELSALDLEIAGDDAVAPINLSVMALPMCGEDTVATFLNPDHILRAVLD